jgi:ketosteroid isomerase-like protein
MRYKVVLDFIDAINSSDVEGIIDLMTDDHVFIDSQGNKTTGKDKLKQAWAGYFGLSPDNELRLKRLLKRAH